MSIARVFDALDRRRLPPGVHATLERAELRVLRSTGRPLRVAGCYMDTDDDGHRCYLVTWPRRPLARSALSRTRPEEAADALWRLACSASPDGCCLRLGCEWWDRHDCPHSDGAVTRLLGDRQIVMSWGGA